MIVHNTPLESYKLGGREILVKREDLCCPPPGPPFSKFRGVLAHVKKLPEGTTIGVLDTIHSKAGWAVAHAAIPLGYPVINYYPVSKTQSPVNLRHAQLQSLNLGAGLVALRAGRSAILYHQAKKDLRNRALESTYMMPNALKLPESVSETTEEVLRTSLPNDGTMVISISSGTIAAGVISALDLSKWDVVLHMGYSRSEDAAWEYIAQAGRLSADVRSQIQFIDEGYTYADKVDISVPFPCNPYYDAKAWEWLSKSTHRFSNDPIVFWNIGD